MPLLAHPEPSRRGGALRGLWLRALAATFGLAASAHAQQPSFTSDTVLSMPLSWSEVNGNNNGVLEPGESAEVRMNVSFSNQFAVAHFAPAIGTFTSGTMLGLGSGFYDIDGTGGTQGTFQHGNPFATNNGTTGYGTRTGWRGLQNNSGSLNATGTGIVQIQFGQFPASPETAWTANPVNRMYAFLWTPSSYAARTVTFAVTPTTSFPTSTASVYLDLDGSVGASVYVAPANLILGSVSIPIVPSPSTFPAAALAALVQRRRRPREPSP